jgi:hypothetical protein
MTVFDLRHLLEIFCPVLCMVPVTAHFPSRQPPEQPTTERPDFLLILHVVVFVLAVVPYDGPRPAVSLAPSLSAQSHRLLVPQILAYLVRACLF